MAIHHDLHQAPRSSLVPKKLPFDVDEMLARLEKAAGELPPPLHTALFEQGYTTVFQHIAIALIAARTPDLVTKTVAAALFRWAPTAEAVNRLSVTQIESLLVPAAFADGKAERLKEIARIAVEKYGGELPARERVLRSLPGIGATCANLTLGLCAEQEKLCVGSHVMRITQRWGLVTATSATGVESQLGQIIPREIWRFVSEWFVAFGDHVCTRTKPKCSRCSLRPYCRQVGVTEVEPTV